MRNFKTAKVHLFLKKLMNNLSYHKINVDPHFILSNLNRVKENKSFLKNCPNNLVESAEQLCGRESLSEVELKIIYDLAAYLPNNVHSAVKYLKHNEVLKKVGEKKQGNDTLTATCTDILQGKDILRTERLTTYCGERSYFFLGHLAKLEHALILYSLRILLKKGFTLVSVPDILPDEIIQRCGMDTKGERTQVYKLNDKYYGSYWCLSGTAEMGLGAFLYDKDIPKEQLPLLLAALSRCYRAEVSKLSIERGLYRVHEFTKVEMFGVYIPDQSPSMLEKFVEIQESIFSPLDIHYQVVDISPHDFGLQAYRKYDIECWMPGLNKYGEISSSSDCTDYQSRRLNIKSGTIVPHTVNGTACAIPRMVVALTEMFQTIQGRVLLPKALQSITNIELLGQKRGPRLHFVNHVPKDLSHNFLM